MKTPYRRRYGQALHRLRYRAGFKPRLVMLILSFGLALPSAAQDPVPNLILAGSVEVQGAYDRLENPSGFAPEAESHSYRAIALHRGLWELQLDTTRFILAHEATAPTDGDPMLALRQAYLSLSFGYNGRLDMGRQELALGLGTLFHPVDPLADSDGHSALDGLALVLSPWANHGIKAVLALDGLWDGATVAGDGSEGGDSLPLGDAWRRLLFGLRYDGLAGAWEPGLAFFFRHGEFLRLAASSRLGLGPAIVRMEGAWDFERPYLYPTGEPASPEGIVGQLRTGSGDWPGGGGMGLAGIDLYFYPAAATLVVGAEYAYQSRGFDRQERLLAQIHAQYQAGLAEPAAALWESDTPAGQWDTRHRWGIHASVRPGDRLSLSGLVVLGMDYPEGVAHSMAELGIELNRPENIDLFLRLRQGWAGRPWDGKPAFFMALIGFRVHY
jgi:hypothetical protein